MKQFLNVLLNLALLKLPGLTMNVKNFNVKEKQLREFFFKNPLFKINAYIKNSELKLVFLIKKKKKTLGKLFVLL